MLLWLLDLLDAEVVTAQKVKVPHRQKPRETQTEVVTDAVNEADTSNDNADSTVSEEQTSEESSADETDNVDIETGKTLVIDFSATGNTKDAAEYIAAETGADIF